MKVYSQSNWMLYFFHEGLVTVKLNALFHIKILSFKVVRKEDTWYDHFKLWELVHVLYVMIFYNHMFMIFYDVITGTGL